MAEPFELQFIPHFKDVPATGTCIFPAKTRKYATCRNHPSDSYAASKIRLSILDAVSRGLSIDEYLEEYARASCCTTWHRAWVSRPDLLNALVSRWARELRRSRINPQPPSQNISFVRPLSSNVNNGSHTGEDRRTQPLQQASPRSWGGFVRYSERTRYSLSDTLFKRLSETDSNEGRVYAFSRDSDPDMLKIGYSTVSIDSRLSYWRRNCGYVPHLQASSPLIPNAKRVERLVHLEMAEFRRREVDCRHNTACTVSHMEWFQVSRRTATAVIDRWAKWMTEAEPYDEHGNLTDQWHDAIVQVERQNRQITSSVLLSILDDVLAENNESGPESEAESQDEIDSADDSTASDASSDESEAESQDESDSEDDSTASDASSDGASDNESNEDTTTTTPVNVASHLETTSSAAAIITTTTTTPTTAIQASSSPNQSSSASSRSSPTQSQFPSTPSQPLPSLSQSSPTPSQPLPSLGQPSPIPSQSSSSLTLQTSPSLSGESITLDLSSLLRHQSTRVLLEELLRASAVNLPSSTETIKYEENQCKICFEAEINAAFVDCGHSCACYECASMNTTCPICRKRVLSVLKIYKS